MMEDNLLRVYGIEPGSDGLPLRTILGALRTAGYPVAFLTGIAGETTDEELDADAWDAAFIRWNEPQIHEIALIERDLVADSEETRIYLSQTIQSVMNHADLVGQTIVANHLRKTVSIYSVQILPALLESDDHDGWAALDVALRCIAAQVDGLIYVPGEGFCDCDGELILADDEDLFDSETDEFGLEEEPEQA